MSRYGKLIFLDEENTGLGVLAAGLFRRMLKESALEMKVYSRGLVVLFPEPANQKIAQIGEKQGISLEGHRAMALSAEDLKEGVLVLAMDNASKARAFKAFPGFLDIHTLKEYVGENGDIRLPIGESLEIYEGVCLAVGRLLERLAEKLKEEVN